MIEKERIEAIKRGIDLAAFIESRGILLKKNGKGYVGLCPFHEDTNPSLSVNPTKNLWQCFGCGTGGDVIRFVELLDKVSFPAAVKKLNAESLPGKTFYRLPDNHEPDEHIKPLSAVQVKLLSRVIDFYHRAFAEDPRAMDYLNKRGITDKAVFSAYKIGFANGTLLNVLPDEGDVIEQLKAIGILNEKCHEHFYGCAAFPLYDLCGRPVGLYGRRIDDMIGGDAPDHLYLPGPRRGLFNYQAARRDKEIILTEAVLDSLTLINAGILNTIPCYGTNGLTDEHIILFKQSGATICIAFDGDTTGRQAAAATGERLTAEGFSVRQIELPDNQDVNSFFESFSFDKLRTASSTAIAADKFGELLNKQSGAADTVMHGAVKNTEAVKAGEPVATNGGDSTVNESITPEATGQAAAKETGTALTGNDNLEPTDYGLAVMIADRRYELRGIMKTEGKLKATVKGIETGKEKDAKRFHVDTVDFYSARSRAFLSRGLSELFGETEQIINGDLIKLLEYAEGWQPQSNPGQAGQTMPDAMTEAGKAEALAFLHNPDLFDELLADMETLGYTGEETNKLLCYIAAVSRKMEEPLSVMIQSRSAAGKSFLQDTVLSLVPDGDFVKYTRLTDQALFYKDSKSLAHKILAIEELDGANGSIYSIRSIQSSKKITIAYTGKDPATGRLRTEENTVEGPIMVFITTTQVEIDGETASRFIFIAIDESEAMTQKILEKQRESQTMPGMMKKLAAAAVVRKHKNANRLLKPLKVVNPYAQLLTFTAKSLRARRDHMKYLNLILACAYLFQYQRPVRTMDYDGKTVEYITVTLADIEKANNLANELMGRSLDELTPPSRNLLQIIREMVKSKYPQDKRPREHVFTRRAIREYSGWSDFQVKTHIRQLEEMEYIYSVVGRKGKEYVYELLLATDPPEDKPFLAGLMDMEQLKEKAREAGITDD
jgi:DNA primase catalytic core